MSHLKREQIPKNWPIERKGTTYVVKPNSSGIPILIVLRNMLEIAQNRKEVKKAVQEKNILLNNKPARDEKNGVTLFDTVSIIPSKKNYRMEIGENGKYKLNEIKESEANKKVSKIVNKKILRGEKIQLNLIDGKNFISEIKCNINDSVMINFKDKKIEKCLPLKEKANAIAFSGKHSGENGIIEKIDRERKTVELKTKKGNIKVLIKQIMITE